MASVIAPEAPSTQILDDWLDYLTKLHPKSIEMGLERARAVWERLATPLRCIKVLIGGTNGKGSSLAMLESICRNAKLRVGSYTSPHLIRFNERICIDGQPQPDQRIISAFEAVERARGETPLTYFEFTTLAALLLFAENDLDICLLEVGLGGRLDAVNIIEPDASLIASIGLDHTDWLGETIDEIALEKAGILRREAPALFSALNPPHGLLGYAEQHAITLIRQPLDYRIERSDTHWDLLFSNPGLGSHLFNLPFPSIPGSHQLSNAAGVIALLRALMPQHPQLAEAINNEQISLGLSQAMLPGRQQHIPGKPSWLLDVAHNRESVATLARNPLVESISRVVFGVLTDKPLEDMLNALPSGLDHWYIAALDSERSANTDRVASLIQKWMPQAKVFVFPGITQAMEAAHSAAQPDETLLVFGSFYSVGEAMVWLEQNNKDNRG